MQCKPYLPRSIIPKLSVRAREIAEHLQRGIPREDRPDYEIFCVKSRGQTCRSWCDYTRRAIVISGDAFNLISFEVPWVASEHLEELFAHYTIAHELAHSYAGPDAKHGPHFMLILKKLCPPEVIHYELGYKPRNAYAAGIRHPDAGKITVNLTPAQERSVNRLCDIMKGNPNDLFLWKETWSA